MRRLLTAGLLWFAAASCGGGGDGGGGPAPIDLVTLSGDTTVVLAGTTPLAAAASAGGVPATAGVTFQWSTSDGAKATVSPTGVVTGVARGSVTITAEAFHNGTTTGITGSRTLRVRIASVVIASGPGPLSSLGDTVTLTAQAKDALNANVGGVAITWSSSNLSVASIDPASGLVTAVANGGTTLIARAQGERSADSLVAVVAQVATTMSITPDTTAFNRIGATALTTVTASDARGHPVAGTGISWASRNQAIATVDGTGAIASTGEGTTYIVGTSGLLADSVKVVVGLVYASVRVATGGILPAPIDTALITRLNGTLQLGLIVRDSGSTIVPNPQGITWSLKTGTIATVGATTGLIAGNTTTGRDTVVVVARTARDSVPLIVRQDVATVTVTPLSPRSLHFVGDTERFVATAKDAGGFAIPGATFTWSSTATGAFTVAAGPDTTTLATAVADGSGNVHAVVSAKTGSVGLTVQRIPKTAALSPNTFPNITAIGDTLHAACVVTDSADDTIPNSPCAWSAGTAGVVSFTPTSGPATRVTALDSGTTSIEATPALNTFLHAFNQVVVHQVATRVKLHPQTADTSRILVSDSMQFVDSAFDRNGHPLPRTYARTYSSSSTAAATVDSTGRVRSTASTGTTFVKLVVDSGKDSAIVIVTNTAITLSGNVQPVFTTNCALSGCHTGASPMQGQNLSLDSTYKYVVGVAANELLGGSGLKRVLPSRPDSSYLVHKIQGTHLLPPSLGTGVQMPEGHPPLSKGTINLIRNWILQGAKNN
jgi:uncharacterized protein YjdB